MIRNALLVLFGHIILCHAAGNWGGELRLTLYNDPRSFDPVLVDELSGETVRYLTGGVLMRVNRASQKPQNELAQSWKLADGGRRLDLQLRKGIRFSDGTPFTAEDVAFTFRRLMDPALRSVTADAFRTGTAPFATSVTGPDSLSITFPGPVPGIERLLDQVAIQSSRSPMKEKAVLGPFMVAEYRPGAWLQLKRNPNYWKTENGRRLPYLDSIRLEILANRDLAVLKLRRGEIHMVEALDAETFERLRSEPSLTATNAGPTTDSEMMWFNQAGKSALPSYKSEWFRSRAFRQAVSQAINRADLVRIVYRGYAQPAAGPVPAGSLWYNAALKPHAYDPASARRKLQSGGFRYNGNELQDAKGNPVSFSVVTNAGNKARARIAALVQQDLEAIGVRVNIVTLDFPSLIERITKSFDYEACLLGFVNIEPDPNGQMNVWLSSAANHAWNPLQKSPATAWEAEIDSLMRLQAASAEFKTRKRAFDRVQEIASVEVPFIYLTNRHALAGVSSSVMNVQAAAYRPHVFWNVEYLSLQPPGGKLHAAAGR